MGSNTYTRQHLEEANTILSSLMCSRSPQEALAILLPGDSPRNQSEYQQAYSVFSLRIRACQPNAGNSALSHEEAYRISPGSPLPPLTLLAHWVRLVILSAALGDYRDALGCVLGNHETACQFGDDNILLAATKTGFGAATLLIPFKPSNEQDSLSAVALTCNSTLLTGSCARLHSEGTRNLCADFYQVLSDLGAVFQVKGNSTALNALQIKVQNTTDRIDRATNNKFKMKSWANETLERLGH